MPLTTLRRKQPDTTPDSGEGKLFIPVDTDEKRINKWLAPSLDQEGALELLELTLTPKKRLLGGLTLLVTSGEQSFTLKGHGSTALLGHDVRLVRVPEGVVLDDTESDLDLIEARHSPHSVPAIESQSMSERLDFPSDSPYAWLSRIQTLDELQNRAHTYEELTAVLKRPRVN